MLNIQSDKSLILFDGVCNLCNTSVQFVIKHDKANKYLFTPLQSKIGQQVIKAYNLDTTKVDSILLYSKDKGLKIKSTAALHIAKDLGFPINVLSQFLVIPRFVRDWVYDYIAKNRYKWYGKKESCMIPTPELQSKFLD